MTERCLKWQGQSNWFHPKTLFREAKHKSRKIRQSLEIKRPKYDGSKANIIRDNGNVVKTNTWAALLRDINDLQSVLQNRRSHCKANLNQRIKPAVKICLKAGKIYRDEILKILYPIINHLRDV